MENKGKVERQIGGVDCIFGLETFRKDWSRAPTSAVVPPTPFSGKLLPATIIKKVFIPHLTRWALEKTYVGSDCKPGQVEVEL